MLLQLTPKKRLQAIRAEQQHAAAVAEIEFIDDDEEPVPVVGNDELIVVDAVAPVAVAVDGAAAAAAGVAINEVQNGNNDNNQMATRQW
jgi:hypothetical protein